MRLGKEIRRDAAEAERRLVDCSGVCTGVGAVTQVTGNPTLREVKDPLFNKLIRLIRCEPHNAVSDGPVAAEAAFEHCLGEPLLTLALGRLVRV